MEKEMTKEEKKEARKVAREEKRTEFAQKIKDFKSSKLGKTVAIVLPFGAGVGAGIYIDQKLVKPRLQSPVTFTTEPVPAPVTFQEVPETEVAEQVTEG